MSKEKKQELKKYLKKSRYHNMSKEKKQELKKYQKNYREAKKKQKILIFFIYLIIDAVFFLVIHC